MILPWALFAISRFDPLVHPCKSWVVVPFEYAYGSTLQPFGLLVLDFDSQLWCLMIRFKIAHFFLWWGFWESESDRPGHIRRTLGNGPYGYCHLSGIFLYWFLQQVRAKVATHKISRPKYHQLYPHHRILHSSYNFSRFRKVTDARCRHFRYFNIYAFILSIILHYSSPINE